MRISVVSLSASHVNGSTQHLSVHTKTHFTNVSYRLIRKAVVSRGNREQFAFMLRTLAALGARLVCAIASCVM